MAKYPGTTIEMKVGDVLYSKKSLSTYFVGHVGIVGKDLNVHHAHPYGPGRTDTIDHYVNFFAEGDTISILRRGDGGTEAGVWAKNHINDIEKYYFNMDLDNVKLNYCSKFVWQAYIYAYNIDISDRNLTLKSRATHIYPDQIRDSSKLSLQGSIKVKK
ncbi:hypothetical protein P9597_09530 [Aneurinibacillus migulanus]|uniref:hypothetical protein n=1 Tax=Aneurinibacillus migulanus TaxID=47500 RepID=UPI002E1A795D|nr:hypothetical protein [Aneurinibacillus migulanus]